MKKLIAALLGLALLTSLGGTARAQELVIARPISTNALDPGFLREAATVVDNIFDTLVMRDAQMRLVPGLAESWRAVDDTTWEFKLRSGVRFTNGEEFNAEAVKFTLERVLDPAARSPTVSYILSLIHI